MRVALTALIGLLAACGGPGPVRWAADPTEPASYSQVLDAWTRHGESYEALEGRLFVDATLVSPAFALALAKDEGERLGLSVPERTALVKARTAEADQQLRFHVAVVTNDRQWNNLDHPEPTFRARLWVANQPIDASGIEHVSAVERDQLRPYFPYATPMAESYWITFPKPANADAVRLRISGGPGRLDLDWELR